MRDDQSEHPHPPRPSDRPRPPRSDPAARSRSGPPHAGIRTCRHPAGAPLPTATLSAPRSGHRDARPALGYASAELAGTGAELARSEAGLAGTGRRTRAHVATPPVLRFGTRVGVPASPAFGYASCAFRSREHAHGRFWNDSEAANAVEGAGSSEPATVRPQWRGRGHEHDEEEDMPNDHPADRGPAAIDPARGGRHARSAGRTRRSGIGDSPPPARRLDPGRLQPPVPRPTRGMTASHR